MFSKDEIKEVASGRWVEIITNVARPIEFNRTKNNDGPCPKCQGKSRFYYFQDGSGGAFCRHCHSHKNGDGISTVEWLNDWDFKTTLNAIGDYLGLEPKTPKAQANRKLKFIDWNQSLLSMFLASHSHRSISENGLLRASAKMATYKNAVTVIALPIVGMNNTPHGWVIASADGGMMKVKDGATLWKCLPSRKGATGLIGSLGEFDQPGPVWKVEGISDMLAALSNWKAKVVTNPFGASEQVQNSHRFHLQKQDLIIVGDCDVPGQKGAKRWAELLSSSNETVHLAALPYPTQNTKGADLRDFILSPVGNITFEKVIDPTPAKVKIPKRFDDPALISNGVKDIIESRGERLIYFEESFWHYKKTHYRKSTSENIEILVLDAMQDYMDNWFEEFGDAEDMEYSPEVTFKALNMTIKRLRSLCSNQSIRKNNWISKPDDTKNYVVVANGILCTDDYLDGKVDTCLQQHNSDYFGVNCWAANFDPAAKSPLWADTIDKLMDGDDERAYSLRQFAGYLLENDTRRQKFLMLEGDGGNGKTTYIAGIQAVLGKETYSTVSLEQFGSEFIISMMLDKVANITGDLSEIEVAAEGFLKIATDGQEWAANRKYKDHIQAPFKAKQIISVNARPRFKDKTNSIWRRMLIIPFRYTIQDDERVDGLAEPWWWQTHDSTSGILNWMLEGLRDLRANGFIESSATLAAIELYKDETDPSRQFFNDCLVAGTEEDFAVMDVIYDAYKAWAKDAGIKHPFGKASLGRLISKYYKHVTKKSGRWGNNGAFSTKYFGVKLLDVYNVF